MLKKEKNELFSRVNMRRKITNNVENILFQLQNICWLFNRRKNETKKEELVWTGTEKLRRR